MTTEDQIKELNTQIQQKAEALEKLLSSTEEEMYDKITDRVDAISVEIDGCIKQLETILNKL